MSETYEALNTPVMRQYLEVKELHPDGIVFFRMGDFYEMFMEDAKIAAQILDITLTKRQNQIPMAGIPYHATESYISRLISAGKKVVVCEQTKPDDPKAKIMSREVVRIITPGTVVEDNLLGGYQNNYLSLYYKEKSSIYLAFADVSTSELVYFFFSETEKERILDTIKRFSPKEMIYTEEIPPLSKESKIILSQIPKEFLPKKKGAGIDSVVHVLDAYLQYNYRNQNFVFKSPRRIDEAEYLILDEQTVSHLELVENPNDKNHTLFGVLNRCTTATGKRYLKQRILFPTRDENKIKDHWDKIEILTQNKKERLKIKESLGDLIDLERVITRFRVGKALPRDFRGIEKSLTAVRQMKLVLDGIGYDFSKLPKELESLVLEFQTTLFDGELPVFLGNSPFLRSGFNKEYDDAILAREKGKDWILELEEKEKKESGCSSLKIRYNKILGYFIEVSKAQAKDVPSHFLKKQTLVTGERFTSPKLEELERAILQADEIIERIEKQVFDHLVTSCISLYEAFLTLSNEVASLDYHLSLTEIKEEYQWTRPEIRTDGIIEYIDSRHPVVETFLPIGERFVPNNLELNPKENAIAVLTGPNMAGKSTFMRQIAINQILFQMGSYVPAKKASLAIVDRIFTRIGSGDNLTKGESTFFVEMKETATILNQFTENSLLIFDEVGRGTSTYDGLSIAWAILEFLSQNFPKPKTIFATHYHELTELEKGAGIFNLYLDTFEKDGEILFLKKVKRGKSKQSFGIYVAKLAGIPVSVSERAKEILSGLESKKREIKIKNDEPSLFGNLLEKETKGISANEEKVINRILGLDPNKIPPLEALSILDELKRILKEEN
ncbi:DNA mismatch repair protein MutS [Leptospira yanagawae serovar Saopaulo str. Sao Paulo = ATCC 700523]|uniref:DNA mismatch repair protein MutS n=1 Tax=Leptospira yanagawae serovar Saopaulo str. Sao Paulo = ATCC 700523 TaxID=1249483 RepID=A0A5E8HC67_9LEPT|nr:DNA mismatch repair protein MutS [Leptospira yanagawae]EOQ88839.1 DNA mismatch repair protein MutS [Leptospira yanagawae serovar Saopaulo str. Sao Paulo = ATCC 700523]